MLVKFTRDDGAVVYVNPDSVETVEPVLKQQGSKITFNATCTFVKESPDQCYSLLSPPSPVGSSAMEDSSDVIP